MFYQSCKSFWFRLISSFIMAPLGPRLVALATQSLILSVLLAVLVRRRKRRQRVRTIYARRFLLRRPQFGEYNSMIAEQRVFDPLSHYQSYRMKASTFHMLLEKVLPKLKNPRPNHRCPIGPDERLSATIK